MVRYHIAKSSQFLYAVLTIIPDHTVCSSGLLQLQLLADVSSTTKREKGGTELESGVAG